MLLQRIVCLVPSITEMLYYLGLENEVVGITKFCIHPKEWHQTKTRIGGTKNIHLQKIIELQPTLIIANKEENVQQQIEALQQHFEVLVTDVNTLEDAYKMIHEIGILTNTQNKANHLITQIQESFTTLSINQGISTAYFIWQNPYMVAANNTFINQILLQGGFINVFGHLERYPSINIEELVAAKPQVVLLSSEPFPFGEKHIQQLQKYLPVTTQILLVDGEMFSWYGSKLLQTASYLKALRQQLQNLV